MAEPLDALLGRVKAALARGFVPAPGEAEPAPALVVEGEALFARFASELAQAGGELTKLRASEAPARAVALAAELGARSFARWHTAIVEPVARALAKAGLEEIAPADASEARERFHALDLGVTCADAAIAETGTLLLRHGEGRMRLATAMARYHLAIVPRARLVASLTDVPRLARAGGALPANAVLVTGPSRTADIEGVQVLGMHGALRLFVFLTEE